MNAISTTNEVNHKVFAEIVLQYLEEIDSWKRLLDFLKAENEYLKVRLEHLFHTQVSETIKLNEKIFHQELSQNDQIIELTRSGVLSHQQWLNRRHIKNYDLDEVIKRRAMVLNQIERTEVKFFQQRAIFNDQLTKNL